MQPTRRTYSRFFRAQVIQGCAQPGASIASIALHHSLNADLVHKRIRLQALKSTVLQPAFIPLPVPLAGASLHPASSNICLEIQHPVRGKWGCDDCETLIQVPVPAQIIDRVIPTARLLSHVMIAKCAVHLPLYRQESIFGRAGLAIPCSTLAPRVRVTGVQLQPLVNTLSDVGATEIESEVRDLEPDLRRRLRQENAVPVMNMLNAWMSAQRDLMPDSSGLIAQDQQRMPAVGRPYQCI